MMLRCRNALAAPIVLLALGGCRKDQTPLLASPSAVSVTIGGMAFNPTDVRLFYTQSGHYWGITGSVVKTGDTSTILVNVPPPLPLNTILTNNNSGLYVRYSVSGGKTYFAGAGYGSASMTLTMLDTVGHEIAGTFSGALHNAVNGNDSLVITNGRFNSSYQVTP